MINPQWLELPISRTNFHGPSDIRAIEVRLQLVIIHLLSKLVSSIMGNLTSDEYFQCITDFFFCNFSISRLSILKRCSLYIRKFEKFPRQSHTLLYARLGTVVISNFTAVRACLRMTASFRYLDIPQYKSMESLSSQKILLPIKIPCSILFLLRLSL